MLRRCLSIICVIALVTANSAPSVAAGAFQRYLGTQYTGIDTYQRAAELTAGLYLRLPFSGGPRHSVSETRFGLSFGARAPSYDRMGGRPLLLGGPQLLDLSIGLRGKGTLRINGLAIDMPALYADGDKGWSKGQWIFAGFVALGAALIIATVISCGDSGRGSSC